MSRPPHNRGHLALLLVLLALAGCGPLASVTQDSPPVATLVGTVLTAAAPVPATFVPLPTATASVTVTRAPVPTATSPVASAPPAGATEARLVKVIDGDTIDVSIGGKTERVRYVGVDTPERAQPGYKSATEANRRLLGVGPLYLVRDVSDRDKTSSHRLLRYVFTADGRLVERELVAGGWAQPVEYPPDTRFAAEFRQLAVEAVQEQRGFWARTPPAGGAMPYGLTTSATEVRKGPGASFAINARLGADTPLTVYARTPAGDWLQVRTPARAGGWINAAAVRLNVSLQAVPVPDKLPTPAAGS